MIRGHIGQNDTVVAGQAVQIGGKLIRRNGRNLHLAGAQGLGELAAVARLALHQQHAGRSVDHGESARLVILQQRVSIRRNLGAEAVKAHGQVSHGDLYAIGAWLQAHRR